MNAKKLMTVALLSSALAACGGGGGGSTTTGLTNTSNTTGLASKGLGYEEYVNTGGVTDVALVADANHLYFARLLVAVTAESDFVGNFRDSGSNSQAQDAVEMDKVSAASAGAVRNEIVDLAKQAVARKSARSAAARGTIIINETFSCSGGGTITFKGEVDNTTYLGQLSATYNDCYMSNVRRKGLATLTLNARDTSGGDFTDYILEYRDLTVDVGWAYYLYTGTQHAVRTLTNGRVTKFVVTSSLKRLDQYTDRITLDMTENTSSLSGLLLSGQLCDGPYGCVTLETRPAFNLSGSGQVVLTGINSSNSQVYYANGRLVSRVDSEGDGTYESPKLVFP